jgi:hypothetical protein
MTFLEFIDRHWGFWFAVFILLMVGAALSALTKIAIVLLAAIVSPRANVAPTKEKDVKK